MRYHASVLAITAGLLSPMLCQLSALGQGADVERSDHATSIERSSDTAVIERSEQDNIAIEALSDDDIALIIRLLGPDEFTIFDTPSPESEAAAPVDTAPVDDGVPLAIHQLADRIGEAYASERYEEVLALLGTDAEVRTARPEVNILEAWSAFKLQRYKQALDLFGSLYVSDPSAANAIGLFYSGMQAERFTHLNKFAQTHDGPITGLIRPGQKAKTEGEVTKLDQLHHEFLQAWLGAAIKYQRSDTIAYVSGLLGIENPTARNSGFKLSQAWDARQKGNHAYAQELFQQVIDLEGATLDDQRNAQLGYALSLNESGQSDAAFQFLKGLPSRDAKLQDLYENGLLSQGYDAFEANDFAASLRLANEADTPTGSNRKAQLLAAWSKFKLEELEQAADDFEKLYRQNPDTESADGVRASFLALNRQAEMNRLAREVDGPLLVATGSPGRSESTGAATMGAVDLTTADQAYYRGQYLFAAMEDDPAYGSAGQVGTPWFGATVRYQYRDGEQGLGEFELLSQKFSMYQSTGRHHLRADVEVTLLESGGDPMDITLVGTRVLPEPGPRPFETTTDGTVIIPSFHWRYEGDTAFEASIGTTPIGGEIDPTVTGHFDVILHNDGAVYTLGAHRRSIYESILSLSGIQDPATGQSYGRVVETGIHAEIFQPLVPNWSLSGQARWGERTGDQVADNNNVMASLSAGYDFGFEGFSYFSVGPSYRYESFDENLSQFTHGHGGYYSPSSLHNVGAGLNFMTEEGKTWIVKGSGSLAYETSEQDQAPYYPLDIQPFDPIYAATDSSGAAATAQLQGAWLLYDQVIAEAGGYVLDANDYSEHGVFFKIRITLGERSELYRNDLTERLFRRYH